MESGSSISERIIVTFLGLIMLSSIAALAYQLIVAAPAAPTGEVQVHN